MSVIDVVLNLRSPVFTLLVTDAGQSGLSKAGLGWAGLGLGGEQWGAEGDCSPGFRASLGISEERCGGLEGSTEGAVGGEVEGAGE